MSSLCQSAAAGAVGLVVCLAQVGAQAENPASGATPAATAPAADDSTLALLEKALVAEGYEYHSGARRDPFSALIGGEEEEAAAERDPGIGDLILVGILWGGDQCLVLAETRAGMGLVLREGDRLRDGRVVAVSQKGVTVDQYLYGAARRLTLPFVTKEEEQDER